ncbi:sugar kinase [Chitinophaga barathri]|uniref:Sugar kinase n=1 Tax=Chitinophaga barathri TaxID=1647451 RepID=A0A3N4MWZ4_9BACT|nr:sugar kinase [Chitinophaga barathri]RPD39913.1 sugar kinase [Chitinophaga barathri]
MNNRLTAFGEFLLRLHCSDDKRFLQSTGFTPWYAGAEANLCVLLARLGIQTQYITRVPENDLAAAGIHQLKGHGVGTDHILYGGHKLGLYFTETGNFIRSTRVIYDRAGSAFTELEPGMINWDKVLEGQQYFHWTGVAAAVSASAAEVCGEGIRAAQQKNMTISADFNYRATLWQYGKSPAEVMPALLQPSHVAVADLDALKVYFNIRTDETLSWQDKFISACNQLKTYMPHLRTLGMSFRLPEGDNLLYTGAIMHNGQPYFSDLKVAMPPVKEPIGTGDAFTAGMLFELINQASPQQIINFAAACGVLKQSIPGDWALISKEEINALIAGGISGRVSR